MQGEALVVDYEDGEGEWDGHAPHYVAGEDGG